jgi:rare lipoprotein A
MRRTLAHGLTTAALVIGLGAAQGPTSSEARSAPGSGGHIKPQQSPSNKIKAYEIGTASWYGQDFEGKPTASGEDYDMYDMTAAHPTLPLGSYVKVTNLRNGRAVVVKVNDRGPVVEGRIIDLSYGAAEALQFQHHGLQRVRLDLIKHGQPLQTVAFNHPPVNQSLAEAR